VVLVPGDACYCVVILGLVTFVVIFSVKLQCSKEIRMTLLTLTHLFSVITKKAV